MQLILRLVSTKLRSSLLKNHDRRLHSIISKMISQRANFSRMTAVSLDLCIFAYKSNHCAVPFRLIFISTYSLFILNSRQRSLNGTVSILKKYFKMSFPPGLGPSQVRSLTDHFKINHITSSNFGFTVTSIKARRCHCSRVLSFDNFTLIWIIVLSYYKSAFIKTLTIA
jgi:hypothetical protein